MSCFMEEPSPSMYRHPQPPLDPSLPAVSWAFSPLWPEPTACLTHYDFSDFQYFKVHRRQHVGSAKKRHSIPSAAKFPAKEVTPTEAYIRCLHEWLLFLLFKCINVFMSILNLFPISVLTPFFMLCYKAGYFQNVSRHIQLIAHFSVLHKQDT